MEMTRLTKLGSCLWICAAYRWRKLAVAMVIIAVAAIVAHAADTADLVMRAGADYRATLTWTQPVTKAAVNLTGNSYAAQFRTAPYPGGALLATYSTVVTNAAAGQMQLRLSKAQTRALSGKAGVWDLKQTDAAGLVSYRFGGMAKCLPTVTQ